MSETTSDPAPRPRYTWPWYLLAAVLLGLVICVVAIKREADRVRWQKEMQQEFPTIEK
jgi:F0F1-type ATP synthase assembly protein I